MGKEKRTCQGKQHFSHPHILKPIVNPTETLTCNACEQINITNNFYGCNGCQYFLHENCLSAPRFLDHSSHPSHHLTLLPVPTYSNRSYTCKACASAGNGFSFSCARCEFDVHMQCALLPQTVVLPQHHHHELELIFESPFDDDADDESTVFVCDLCRDNVDLNYWLYYCADCDFGAHLECAISKSLSQQEPKLPGNKSNANPIIIKKTEEELIKTQKTNQKEEDEEKEEEEEREIARSIVIDKHPHELELCFGSPYDDKVTQFACDICKIIMDRDESLYYCADCDFLLHLQCASPDADFFPTSQQCRNLNPNPNPTGEMINGVKNKVKKMKHFSHPHDLELSEIQQTEEILCSGCEDKLLYRTPNYKCTKSNCEFTLHKSCFELQREIQHNSHPNHPLTLHPTLRERDSLYSGCNACGEDPKSFVYECLECNFSLHAKCATCWPENVTHEDHQHSLKLRYEWPFPSEYCVDIFCKVCYGLCNDSKWLYYCAECNLGMHLQCATTKKEDCASFEKEDVEENQEMTNEQKFMKEMIKAQGQQVALNFQAQMAIINTQTLANMWRRYY